MKRCFTLFLLLFTISVCGAKAPEYRQILNPKIAGKSHAAIDIPKIRINSELTHVTVVFHSDEIDASSTSLVLMDELGNEAECIFEEVHQSPETTRTYLFSTEDINAKKLTLAQRNRGGFTLKGIDISNWEMCERETTLSDVINTVKTTETQPATQSDITLDFEDEDTPEPELAESAWMEPGKYKITCQTSVNIRSGPGTTYEVLGRLTSDDEVTAIKNMQDDWVEIEYGLIRGYIKSAYLVSYTTNLAEAKNHAPGTLMNWVSRKIFILKYFNLPQWAITAMTWVAIVGLAVLLVVFCILIFRGMFFYIWMWPLMILFFQWGFIGPAVILTLFSWLFLIPGIRKKLLYHLLLWTSLLISGAFFWVFYNAESSWTALFSCGLLVVGSFWFYTSLNRLFMFCKCPHCGYVGKHYVIEKELTSTRVDKEAISKKVYSGTTSSNERRRLNNETVTDSQGRTHTNHSTDYDVDVRTDTDHYVKRRGIRVKTTKEYWYTLQCRSCYKKYSFSDSEYNTKDYY